MLDFVTDSIKYMETWTREYDNPFDMNRRGYVFLTNKKENNYSEEAKYAQSIGLGEARVHTKNLKNYRKSDPETVDPNLDGMDIIHGHELIREVFPFVSSNVVSMKHVRKCGWVNAKKLGQFLINRVTEKGAKFIQGNVFEVTLSRNDERSPLRVKSVHYKTENSVSLQKLDADYLVLAVGPKLRHVGSLLGVDFPVFCEIHAKVRYNDPEGIIPRDAPLILHDDMTTLEWSPKQKDYFNEKANLQYLLKPFRGGVHVRPWIDSPTSIAGIWTYNVDLDLNPNPGYYPKIDPWYAEIILRGLGNFIPAIKKYWCDELHPKNPWVRGVDVGYYCKTKENRPLIGPIETSRGDVIKNVFVCSALSGYGIMASPAAGSLVAAHLAGDSLPSYSKAFLLSRYRDPQYIKQLETMPSGQL